MKQSNDSIEVIVAWGSMLVGLIACLIAAWLLLREVRRGKVGRFAATAIQGVGALFLGIVPVAIASGVKWLAALSGVALFSRDAGNDGNLVGLGFMGMIVALGVAVLFSAVMLFQALTGSGMDES